MTIVIVKCIFISANLVNIIYHFISNLNSLYHTKSLPHKDGRMTNRKVQTDCRLPLANNLIHKTELHKLAVIDLCYSNITRLVTACCRTDTASACSDRPVVPTCNTHMYMLLYDIHNGYAWCYTSFKVFQITVHTSEYVCGGLLDHLCLL